jgi:uncharacterized cupin superfamily protein
MNDRGNLVTRTELPARQDSDEPGLRRLSKAAGMDRLTIAEARLGPGQRLKGPGAGRERFIYILQGPAEVQTSGANLSLETGDFLGFSASDAAFELGNPAVDDLIYLQGQAARLGTADDDQ